MHRGIIPFPKPCAAYCKKNENLLICTHMKKTHTHFQHFAAGFVLSAMYFVYMLVILPTF